MAIILSHSYSSFPQACLKEIYFFRGTWCAVRRTRQEEKLQLYIFLGDGWSNLGQGSRALLGANSILAQIGIRKVSTKGKSQ